MVDHRNKLDTYSNSLLNQSRFEFTGNKDYWLTGYTEQTPIEELRSYFGNELDYSLARQGNQAEQAILRQMRVNAPCGIDTLFKDCSFNSLRFGFSANNVGIYRDPTVTKLLAQGPETMATQLVQTLPANFLQNLTRTDNPEQQQAFLPAVRSIFLCLSA